MAYTKFATSEPWDPASGERLNKLGDELQEQINVLYTHSLGAGVTINLNELTTEVEGWVSSATNAPKTSTPYLVRVKQINDYWVYQEITEISSTPKKYYRFREGENWKDWKNIAETQEFSTSDITFYNSFSLYSDTTFNSITRVGNICHLSLLMAGSGTTNSIICSLPVPLSKRCISYQQITANNVAEIRVESTGIKFYSGTIPQGIWMLDISYECEV